MPRQVTPPSLLTSMHVVRLALFGFLSPRDACRLLATCRPLRLDTDNVALLLQLSPVTSVVFHSQDVSSRGCLPSPHALHEVSCASAFTVAAQWEHTLLPMCYQWHHGRRISLRLEPFVLPLDRGAHCPRDIHDALETVLVGLGRAYLAGMSAKLQLAWESSEPRKAIVDADTEEEDDAIHALVVSDPDDSDWGDSDSDSDDGNDLEGIDDWLDSVSTGRYEPRLHTNVCQRLLRLLNTNKLELVRWASLPTDSTNGDRGRLLVGLSPTHTVLGGVFVKARVY